MLKKIFSLSSFFIGFCFFFIFSFLEDIMQENQIYVCKHNAVVEIVSIHHRSANVKLDNGEIIKIDQPRDIIKKGSVIPRCESIDK